MQARERDDFMAQQSPRGGVERGVRATRGSENADAQRPQAAELRERGAAERDWPNPVRPGGSGEAQAEGPLDWEDRVRLTYVIAETERLVESLYTIRQLLAEDRARSGDLADESAGG